MANKGGRMLSLTDILASIVKTVKTVCPNISTQDVKEGYKKKTIYVYLDDVNSDDYMRKYNERNISVAMVYFPEDERKSTVELLDVQDKLTNLFAQQSEFEIKDGIYGVVSGINSHRQDGVLAFDFDLYVFEAYDEVKHENMEELNI